MVNRDDRAGDRAEDRAEHRAEDRAGGGDGVDRLAAAVAALQTELNRADRASAIDAEVGSAEELQILRLLLSEGPVRVGALAALRSASMTTTSSRISRLEKKGLVVRERIPGDLRAMVVRVTEAGEAAARRSREARLRALAPVAEDFPLDALDRLIEALAAQTSAD